MITVYELERRVPKYHGLCGLKTEKAIYVRVFAPFDFSGHIERLNLLNSTGWKVAKKRVFPTKVKTGGFTRRIN